MILDTWNFGHLGSYLGGSVSTLMLVLVYRLIRSFIRRRARKAEVPIKVESRVEYFRLFSLLLIFIAVTLGAILLVVINVQQTSVPGRVLSIAAGGVAVLIVILAAILGIGVPAYRFTLRLKADLQVLKEELKAALAQNRRLEGTVSALEAKLQNLPPEQSFLLDRKSARKIQSRREQKASKHRDVDYLEEVEADVGD